MISLNLLSPERKKMFYWRKNTKKVIAGGIKIICMLIFFSVPLLAINIYLVGKINALDAQIVSFENTANVRQLNSVEKSFKEINNIFIKVNKISEDQIYWSDVFDKLIKITPLNAQIFSLEIDPEGKFTFAGKAKTREDVLELGRRLKNSPDFKDIQTSLDNLTKRNDVDFKFSGNILLDNFKAKTKVRMENTDQI